MGEVRYVKGRDSVAFMVDGEPVIIPQTHVNYFTILDALDTGDIEQVRPLLRDVRETISDELDGLVTVEDRTLMFDGKPLHNSLSARIVSLMRDGMDIKPLVNFFRNLMDNPSKVAVDELYLFLDACDLPLTADGHFIAYKMVNADFTDKYTGKMDNSPGAKPSMRRNEVDDRRNNTCSSGLHFASLHYVTDGHFGSRERGDKLIAVKVNPADVVSIPSDYNNSKGRACQYEVIRELSWNETLPVNNTGFRFLNEDESAADDGAVLTLTQDGARATQARPGQTVWADEDIRKVKVMLRDGAGLTEVERAIGMSRRQVARIRDGEVGTHVTI